MSAHLDRRYKNYLLILLMAILAFNYMDRWAIGIVLQDIKVDLNLSDTQLGFLTGIAFAVFYSVMGIPIARWADRGNRATIIALSTGLWSAAVALCGVVSSFTQLLLVRIVVGVGEAGCIPPAHSLLADVFSRDQRPRAVARYMMGVPLSLAVGYLAAGWLNELYGWRATFVILGLPGLALAALARFTVREPRRMKAAEMAEAKLAALPSGEPSFKEVCVTLWINPAFRNLLFCFSVWYFFGYGIFQWQPAFFIRSHGLETGELGTWFALIFGVGGLLGVYLGGELASRYAAGNERLQLVGCAVAAVFFALCNIAAYLAPHHYWAFALLGLANLGNVLQGPILATLQTLVPPRMRAISLALVYLFANLIGMGFGPLAAGALSDALRPWFGEESLRYALIILSPGFFWVAWHLWRASRTVAFDLKAAQVEHDAESVMAHVNFAAPQPSIANLPNAGP
jgi:MFS transporter, Spinster family, sphingosine-1-phosphate transporter